MQSKSQKPCNHFHWFAFKIKKNNAHKSKQFIRCHVLFADLFIHSKQEQSFRKNNNAHRLMLTSLGSCSLMRFCLHDFNIWWLHDFCFTIAWNMFCFDVHAYMLLVLMLELDDVKLVNIKISHGTMSLDSKYCWPSGHDLSCACFGTCMLVHVNYWRLATCTLAWFWLTCCTISQHDGHVFGFQWIDMILDCMFDVFGLRNFDFQDLHDFWCI